MRQWSLRRKLFNYPEIEKDLPDLVDKICMERARLQAVYGASAQALSGMPGCSGPGDPCGSAVIDRLLPAQERLRELEQRLEERMDVMREVEAFLGRLDALELAVIRLRYFSRLSWPEISAMERISRTTLYRIHDGAFDRVAAQRK
ncbi:MAG: hypothetical protein EOM58_10455 [Clostridia bacterium]|nr:hypothetical protein [Clostridia bacterium]